nr:hypothetical protein [uncultured Meiothermus sp.]
MHKTLCTTRDLCIILTLEPALDDLDRDHPPRARPHRLHLTTPYQSVGVIPADPMVWANSSTEYASFIVGSLSIAYL